MQSLQENKIIFIEEEGFISLIGDAGPFRSVALEENALDAPAQPKIVEEPPFKFGRMFPLAAVSSSDVIDESVLDELGRAMEKAPAPGDNEFVSSGYTYLAQFIAHDLSYGPESVAEGPFDLSVLSQKQSPYLDLASFYSGGPDLSPQFYTDGVRMKIGLTLKAALGQVEKEFENDLPRDNTNQQNPRKAIIADPRNDDNLILAQTHVAFLKFHNAVADFLEKKPDSTPASFKDVREKVVKHYQWIALYDLLPKIIDESVLTDLLNNPSKRLFKVGEKAKPSMPVEFSYAAFRLGHCMARDEYEYNRVFQSPQQGQRGPAKLRQLIAMTGFRGEMRGLSDKLPSNWIIDWTRFYDFSKFGINSTLNQAKLIGPHLPSAMAAIPGLMNLMTRGTNFISLASTDLIHGNRLKLPTGQKLAAVLKAEDPKYAQLSSDEILQSSSTAISVILKKHGFDEQTPLFYYILKEAEIKGKGKHLGPVGSRIVAETFITLIEASPFSILDGSGWKPELGQLEKDKFTMSDLLFFVNKFSKKADPAVNELNPIG